MSQKIWMALGVSLAAYFAWRTYQWRTHYTSGILTPWGQSFSLAVHHPFTNPVAPPQTGTAGITGKGTAGDGTGKSGPTIVSVSTQKKTGVSADGGQTWRTL